MSWSRVWTRSKAEHPTRFVTGLVNLERRVIVDLIEGNTPGDVRAWLGGRPDECLDGITTAAADLEDLCS